MNTNLAALIPVVGRTSASGSSSTATVIQVFPASASFVAPRDLKCVVTIQPYVVTGTTTSRISWSTAMKVGSTVSFGPSPGPGPLSVFLIPVNFGSDRNYFGTFTEVFNVTAGSAVSFGAQFTPQTSGSYFVQVNVVYSCTLP